MLKLRHQNCGLSLIEILIVLAIVGIVVMAAMPTMATMLQSAQIRNSAESVLGGLQLARAEAVRRNATMRFQLTTSVGNDCALSASGTNWVISQASAAEKCATAPADVAANVDDPMIKQVRSSTEGTRNVTITSTLSSISFTPLGQQPTGAAAVTLNFANPTGGACVAAAGEMRCLRVLVSPTGQVKMCDPARPVPVAGQPVDTLAC